MPKFWMVNSRDRGGTGMGLNPGGLTYYVTDKAPLNEINNWTRITLNKFRILLIAAADSFPEVPPGQGEDRSHVTILVGRGAQFGSSATFYENVCNRLFDGPDSLGLCILYDWPGWADISGYGPDRARARQSGEDLADVISVIFDWLSFTRERERFSGRGHKSKVSLIAHGMGDYVVQKAMAVAWTRKYQPMHANVFDELVMVAADVDDDLFDANGPENSDATAMVNLAGRITVLYTARDGILDESAKLKRFGTQVRLGHAGLAHYPPIVNVGSRPASVWDVDCSSFFPASVSSGDIHGAYFRTDGSLLLMRQILRGIDQRVLQTTGVAPVVRGEQPSPAALEQEAEASAAQRTDDTTRVERVMRRIKNNPLVAAVIVLGVVVIGIAKFTDALGQIYNFFSGSSKTEAGAGKAISEALTHLQQNEKKLSTEKLPLGVSPEKIAERRLMIEISHRASEALKQLEQDQTYLRRGAQYESAAIYYDVVCHLDNSCPPQGGVSSNYSVFPEYHTSTFQSLIENLMEIEGPATQPQLKRAWGAFKELDDLSRRTEGELSKQRPLEAVAKATEIIKSNVIGDYLKSPMD